MPQYHPPLPGSQGGADVCVPQGYWDAPERKLPAQSSDKRVRSLHTPGPCSPTRGEGRTHDPCPTQPQETASAYFSRHMKNVVLPQLSNLLGFQDINGTDINHNCILKLAHQFSAFWLRSSVKLARSGGTVHCNKEISLVGAAEGGWEGGAVGGKPADLVSKDPLVQTHL